MISNLFLQLSYIELLTSYPVKDIASFVKRDSRFTIKLLNNLYFEDSVLDGDSHRFVADNLVTWLYERGENPDQFIRKVVERCKDFECIPARGILRSYLPYVPSFYNVEDARMLCLELIPKRYPFLTKFAVLSNEVIDGNRKMSFTFRFDTPTAFASNPTRWVLGMISLGPVFLNSSSYEHLDFYANQISFIEALENRKTAEKIDGKIYIEGRLVGEPATFADCLNARNIAWDNDVEKNVGCVLALEDVFDSTGASLIRKGCYYGAPANILDVEFTANIVVPDPFLRLMSSVVKQEFSVWQPIQKAQEQLLEMLNDSVTIVYYKNDDSISVNSKHLMRNVPARILRNLLREYTATGREEFENREFKRDPSICMDSLRPNFESRLNRVILHINGSDEMVAKEGVRKYFEIERHRRGGFRFVPKCKIIFREE